MPVNLGSTMSATSGWSMAVKTVSNQCRLPATKPIASKDIHQVRLMSILLPPAYALTSGGVIAGAR